MLLFGAGASKEAEVPTAYGLTSEIASEFRRQRHLDRHTRVVSFVLGGLLFNRGIQGDDPLNSGVNVEDFFNAIQSLADRGTLEAAPFVGSWHAMIDEFDKIQPPAPHGDKLQEIIFRSVTEKILSSIPNSLPSFGASDIDKKIESAIKRGVEAAVKGRSSSLFSSDSVGREIGDFVMETLKKWSQQLKQSRPSGSEFQREFQRAVDQQPRPGEGRIFREVGDMMIQMLVKFVFVQDATRVLHLRPIGDLLASQPRLTIASLNYDNCVELHCQEAGLRCDTGIDEWSSSGTFGMTGDGILLLKLHGSIDWKSTEGRSTERPMPHRVITRASPEEVQQGTHRPAVIFGHRNKLTAEGPFLDLLRAFQRELSKTDRLTVVGYSFADLHINVFLSHWLNASSTHRLRIINPAFKEGSSNYGDELIRYASGQVEIIKETAGKALERLFGIEQVNPEATQVLPPSES